MLRVACVAIAAMCIGCFSADFECDTDTQCRAGTARGTCEATGFCSLPDGSCGSGRRYDDSASSALSGNCVVQRCFSGLDASSTHTCGIVNRRAQCWGGNGGGQLGNGNTVDADAPQTVNFIQDVRQIDVGTDFTCAVDGPSDTYCWGEGGSGQLGNSAFEDERNPDRIDTEDCGGAVIAVTAGDVHACGLTGSGGVCCWGDSSDGRLGGNIGGTLAKGRLVPDLTNAVRVSAGGAHTCAVDTADQLWCWGSNASGQLGTGPGSPSLSARPLLVPLADVREVSAGGNHTCALTVENRLHCWGDDAEGQVGDGAPGDSSASPFALGLEEVASVTAGERHSCAILADHSVLCWGFGESGQLGDGGTVSTGTPTPLTGNASDVFEVTVGGVHSCAVRGDGTAQCWGGNDNGELGAVGTVLFGTASPTPVGVALDGCTAAQNTGEADAGTTGADAGI